MKEIPVTFKSKGQQIVGILHLPTDETSAVPAVILCHGLFRNKSSRLFVSLSRELSKNGFVALRFDFRGCGDSEGRPEDYCFTSELQDIDAGIDFLANQPSVDKNKIGLLGHSRAGTTTIIKTSQDERIKCLVVSGTTALHKKFGRKKKSKR